MEGEVRQFAVVTAGGTREPIDDVRVVANVSSGRFGARIANALVEGGARVILVGSRELLSHERWIDDRVETVPFSSYADLSAAIDQTVEREGPPTHFFMAAAVADFSPVPAPGKISSDVDELVVRMRRNPKILARLRPLCGPETFIVGFKLLAGVGRAELVDAARAQLERDLLDLTVGNDLAEIRGGEHPVVLVGAQGGPTELRGSKAEVAAALVERCLRARSPE